MSDEPKIPPPGAPSRDLGTSLRHLGASPGARKEALRKRDFHRPSSSGSAPVRYAELRTASAFSFLDAASQPEDLIVRAAALDLGAVALVDAHGVYGAPRFFRAAREAGIKALVGAEIPLASLRPMAGVSGHRGPLGLVPDLPPVLPGAPSRPPRLTLLAASRRGYQNLCRLLTAAARGRPKGQPLADWDLVAAHAEGLHCLTGGDEAPLARLLGREGREAAGRLLDQMTVLFGGRLHVELQRHGLPEEEARNTAFVELARRHRLPLVATNGVRYANPGDKPLHDVLTVIREHTTLEAAGRLLACQRERHLKGAAEMARLFADLPAALEASAELAEGLSFTLADLGYRFPDYPLPPGETPSSYLRQVTWAAAPARFRPLSARAQAQIEKELAVIEKLDLAGYFLIVWDVVRFCQREGMLAQGRGSAANSAVCYALGITAVDPVKMGLLFERFLSEERGEWPDIDLDLPSGAKRERVIQYVYGRYGPHGAAMTANVITYRDRSSTREVAKALGYSAEQIERLARRLGTFGYDVSRGDDKALDRELAAAGLDPEERRNHLFAEMWQRIHHLPRHLGQHSGGMVIAAGRLDEVVPLEPSATPNRPVIQWDKDDCADLGIVKVDLLGLGMLNALEEMVPLIREKEGVPIDLAHLPPDDPATFGAIRRADTVGMFQIESRAQMASLPRHQPRRFYDLVVQVAIIRPGPIVGGMVHPFFERKRGRQPVVYPHPSLEPVLERTLGVPLFQEQILRVAMVVAGFTGGEAEELRRAMGFKRSRERMQAIEQRLIAGMTERGLPPAAQEEVLRSITSFALYGFPESHAASFALIAYASAYLKVHHPTAFLIGLLNAWPMGFYHPATLIHDAARHGVEVRPIEVGRSGWNCRWEERAEGTKMDPRFRGDDNKGTREHRAPARRLSSVAGAVRLGLRYVRGLKQETGRRIEEEAASAPFLSIDDLMERCRLGETEAALLAEAGALAGLGASRRAALWQVAWTARAAGPLLADQESAPSPLEEMSPLEETVADFAATGLTVRAHPLAFYRPQLERWGAVPTAALERLPAGERVRIGGSVIVRQRPGTAKGVLFVTVEDETGMAQAIFRPELLAAQRAVIVGSPGLLIEGTLQKKDGSLSLQATRCWSLGKVEAAPSHDFR